MPGKVACLIAAAAAVAGLAGCNAKSVVSTDTSGNTYQWQSDPNIHLFPAADRQRVGTVRGESLEGKPLALADYRGKVVVVNYWSSNCAPCDQEADWLRVLSNRERSAGVQFVGIDERDNRAAALNFQRAHRLPYPSIFDQSDAFVLDFPGAVPATTPFTVVIDRQGGIAAKATNSVDYTHLQKMIDFALQGTTT
jgi:peroxiredoxin